MPPDLVPATAELVRESGFTHTGANLVDEASNLLTLACATGDVELLREAALTWPTKARVTTEEGVQVDASFHQHGPSRWSSAMAAASPSLRSGSQSSSRARAWSTRRKRSGFCPVPC